MAEENEEGILEEFDEGDSSTESSDDKKSKLASLLANRVVLISAILTVVLLIVVAVYFFVFSGSSEETVSEENASELAQPSPDSDTASSEDTIELPSIDPVTIEKPDQSTDTDSDIPSPPPQQLTSSRLEAISQNVVNPPKRNSDDSNNNDSNENDVDSLKEKVKALEMDKIEFLTQENQKLKAEIAKLREEDEKVREQLKKALMQLNLYRNMERAENMSVPIDELSGNTTTSPVPFDESTIPSAILEDYKNDYSNSPYADDAMTPKPSWGENK
jgi:flagellar basal body-associated protein FliL